MRNRFTKFNVGPESLTGCRFFDGLEPEERARIVRHCEGRRYDKGARILSYGENTRDVFFLCSGRVQSIVLTTDWRNDDCEVLTSQELEGGAMFGELSAIDGEPRSTSVVAVEESCVLRMSGPSFQEIIARHPVLNERTMLRLCALARYLCDRSIVARTFSIPQQIALELLRVVSAYSTHGTRWEMDPAPKHWEIARRVGTNREQVTRVVSKLVEAKLIERERGGRRWTIPDGPALLDHLSAAPPG